MVTLDGTLLYFVPGEYEQHWPTHIKEWSPQQWDWLTGGNKTAKVTAGEYAIFLNETIRIDVTTEWTQWSGSDEYLIMKNGTWLNVQWDSELNRYITMINDKFYTFKDVHTLCNLTDSGVTYSVYDPYQRIRVKNQWDRWNRILTPTSKFTTTIDRDNWIQNSLWINATSDSVLHEGTDHYLINASDLTRLNVTTVSSWWNETSMGDRDKIFKGIDHERLLEYHKPRYNITIDGKEYFVIDPSPIGETTHSTDRWNNKWDMEPWNALYRYPETFNTTLDGTIYTIQFKQPGANHWDDRPFPEDYPDIRFSYRTIDLYNGLDVEEEGQWKAALSVTFGGEEMTVELEDMNIYKKHTIWGELYTWKLTELDVMTVRSIWDLVVGTPDWGMWDVRTFKTVPETGAVDLDGDLSTTEDQYFVKRLHYGADSWNRTEDRMWVEIIWNPNSSMKGDEVHLGAWTGRVRTSWSFEWNEYFIWYYASNVSRVRPETMNQINSTLIDSDTGMPKPGYWDIAHMAKNSTWEDLLAQAQREGWDWIKDNTNEWEWIWFGFSQDYQTSWVTEGMLQQAGVGLRYEFAGLSLYNFTKQTHYFMPKTVGNVTFVTPGESFGNMNSSDTMLVGVNESVTFGVTYEDVNGTIFPFVDAKRSIWGWYDSMVHGADFGLPNFKDKPIESTVNEITLAVHFNTSKTTASETNNEISIKIDQHIGDWTLDHDIIDGRTHNVNGVNVYLRGNNVLQNRSLAANWYVTAYTDMKWQVRDDKGTKIGRAHV